MLDVFDFSTLFPGGMNLNVLLIVIFFFKILIWVLIFIKLSLLPLPESQQDCKFGFQKYPCLQGIGLDSNMRAIGSATAPGQQFQQFPLVLLNESKRAFDSEEWVKFACLLVPIPPASVPLLSLICCYLAGHNGCKHINNN